MSDNVAPMPDARRGDVGTEPEERLEQVVAHLTRLASEFPHAMNWVEAEVEALRSEVRQTLKAIAERNAADRDSLARQVAGLHDAVAAMNEALVALRDEVIARAPSSGSSTRPGSTRPA